METSYDKAMQLSLSEDLATYRFYAAIWNTPKPQILHLYYLASFPPDG